MPIGSICEICDICGWLSGHRRTTNEKDFGEKVYRGHHPHRGIVFPRLGDERAANKVETLDGCLMDMGSLE